MDRNNRILRINDKTINFYSYYITNSCMINFVDVKIDEVIKFFGNDIIEGFDELDSVGDVIRHEDFYLKRKHISIEPTTILVGEEVLVREAWDELLVDEEGNPVINSETGKQLVIHHEAEYKFVEKSITVEMTTIYLEAPEITDEISDIRNQVTSVKDGFNTVKNDVSVVKDDVEVVKNDIVNVKETIEGMDTPSIDEGKYNAILFIAQNTAQTLSDDQALIVKDIYKTWDKLVEEKFVAKTKGHKFTHKDVLYKTIQDNISFQSNWVPGEGTESMFKRIDETHAGTKEDPIPYFVNMEVFKDKYYTENGILYKCTRDSQIALHNKASELVGHYFEIVK